MKLRIKRLFVIPVLSSLVLTFLVPGCGPSAPTNTPTPEPPPEQPSVPSQPDLLTDTVVNSDLIVLGTITDKKYDIVTVESGNTTGKYTYTYTIFTLSVEKVIKGDPTTTQVFIRTLGGEEVGAFLIEDRILALFNRGNDNFYTLSPYGIHWMESPTARARSIVKLQNAIARILQIMMVNNIPIALPTSEWPPLPTGPISIPKK